MEERIDWIVLKAAYGTAAGQLDTSTLQTFLATANYAYDELGNLIRDRQEEIANIEWTVYGKIKAVTRTGTSTKPDLAFGYDAGGNRLWKKVTPKGAGAIEKIYYYLRDPQGNEPSRRRAHERLRKKRKSASRCVDT